VARTDHAALEHESVSNAVVVDVGFAAAEADVAAGLELKSWQGNLHLTGLLPVSVL